MVKSESTEQKILEAARKIFTQKGLSGARMQEIADEAGINKALLHYYFRRKDMLFEKIFEEALDVIFSNIIESLGRDLPMTDKLKLLVDSYITTLTKNPYLPNFVMNEINQNPERLIKIFNKKSLPKVWGNVIFQLTKEIDTGKIRPVHPIHLLLNILGMIIFPFAMRPMIEPMITDFSGMHYDELLKQRGEIILEFVKNALEIPNHEN